MTQTADQQPGMPQARALSPRPEAGEDEFPGVDLDLLAYDIADMLGRCGYPVDAADCHIRPELPAFLRAITANAAADDSGWESEAMSTGAAGSAGGDDLTLAPDAALADQRGRAPKMAYCPWFASQRVELGAVTAGEWYWRCPVCHVWAGPCGDRGVGKQVAMDHRHDAHDRPAAARTEARVAARRVCKDMTAARLDEMTARLADAHGLTAGVVHAAICRTATAIDGLRSTWDDVLFYTGKDLGTARDGDYLKAPHPRVSALVSAIAADLGHPGWLEDRMAASAGPR